MHNTYLWFGYQKMEVPGTLHHLLVRQDTRHTGLPQGWSLDLPRNLEQMLHPCLDGTVETQTKHIQPTGTQSHHVTGLKGTEGWFTPTARNRPIPPMSQTLEVQSLG
jgi:hypothetical protein